jgi:D-arabinose 1-dehydrogenase-like Zn-dependent alcohol dehydrogenase
MAYDGGYADYMIAPVEALAAIPDDLAAAEAAPLLCAGITTYNSLRHSGARPGDLVAVLGIGGLGHLGVQFAVKMGFRTVAIARGADKAKLALELGAHRYIDSQAEDAAKVLTELGGARVILATVTSGKAMTPLIDASAWTASCSRWEPRRSRSRSRPFSSSAGAAPLPAGPRGEPSTPKTPCASASCKTCGR